MIVTLLTSGVGLQQAAGLNLLLIFLLILRLVVHQYNYVVEGVVSRSQLETLANADPLTKLPNRRAFIDRLDATFNKAGDGLLGASVAMIDLDGFKAINDTYGHAAGDAVLVEAAARIQSVCTSCQMVARLGGDEFAALIFDFDDVGLNLQVGRTLVDELSRPYFIGGSYLRLAASIGIATHAKTDASAMSIMSRADVALYEVKHFGGSGVRLFEPTMETRLRRRITIEQALRETNPVPQIEVVYQLIFEARSRRIASFEALARWDHPQLGAIKPLEFISIAEQIGVITKISERIFETAIKEAAGWDHSIGLSINLSAIDLCHANTPRKIMSLCERHGLDPRRLEIEVTETSVLSDFDTARKQLDLLRSWGIRVALDDFGSGFASISYLKEITFDRVKIDGQIISGITTSQKSRRLLQGIVQLCASIGVPATAEKVESEEQAAILIGLGCDRLQGYLLGRPVGAVLASPVAARHRAA